MERRRKLRKGIRSQVRGALEYVVKYNTQSCAITLPDGSKNIFISEPFNRKKLPTLIDIDPKNIHRRSRSLSDLEKTQTDQKSGRRSRSLPLVKSFVHDIEYTADDSAVLYENFIYFKRPSTVLDNLLYENVFINNKGDNLKTRESDSDVSDFEFVNRWSGSDFSGKQI